MKRCSKCGQKKPLNKFNKQKASKDGLCAWCRDCSSKYNREYARNHQQEGKKRHKKYVREHREKIKDYQYQWLYGLTSKQRLQIYINQNGCCAICKKATPYDKIKTDHNHKTDKIRGLLCNECNLALGFIEKYFDNIDFILKYLKGHLNAKTFN